MNILKSLVVVVVVVTCLFLVNADNIQATGWCCPAGKGEGGGCPGTSEDFQPFIFNARENDTVTYTWKTRAVTCPPTSTLVHYDNITHHFYLTQEDELLLSYTPRVLFMKDTHDYCLEGDHGGNICRPDLVKTCGSGVCIPKCCGEGEALDMESYLCVRSNQSLALQFYSTFGESVPPPASVVIVGDQEPDCAAQGGFPHAIAENVYLLVNGKLLDYKDYISRDFDQYCIDNLYDAESEMSQMVIGCSESESKAIYIKRQLMKVGYIISDVFLIISILFHAFIPSLRDTQGWILLSHMVSMLVALTVLFVLSIFSTGMSNTFCIFNAFVFQYSFLAMFFWLNIMCFDIWRVIRATARGIPLLGILSNDAKKFQMYCLYGWGFPLVIGIVTGIMHSLPEELAKDITRPGFGKVSCWLPGDLEHLIYCYAYVAALFILDLFFVGHTIFMLYQAGNAFTCFARQVSVTAFNRKHLEAFWQRFGMFVLMVFCWTAEILSWKIHPQEIWIVTDFINSLQGFIIFIIFMSSKKRRDLIKELMQKATICCLHPSSEARPSVSQVATWNVNTPSTSISGSSGFSKEGESHCKTDTTDTN